VCIFRINTRSNAHCPESLQEIGRRKRVLPCPRVHVGNEVVWDVARNGELLVGSLEAPVEVFDNVLVKLDPHWRLDIGDNVHLCEKRERHERAVHLSKDAIEALLYEAVDKNNQRSVAHVNVAIDLMQQRECERDDAFDTQMLHLILVDFACHHVAKQRLYKDKLVLDVRQLHAYNEQRDLLLGAGL